MVKLRLTRLGRNKAPTYRIVATDARTKRDGAYIDLIGTYNPLEGKAVVSEEKALKWLSEGAQLSDTVRNIFSKEGIMTKFHNSKNAK